MFARVCVCATPDYLWHLKLWNFFLFFYFFVCVAASSQIPVHLGGNFQYLYYYYYFKLKSAIFCDFFNSLISIYDFDFLTICAEYFSTSNKKKNENRCNRFLYTNFWIKFMYILQCDASRFPPLPYHWQNLLEKALWVL